ncbi:MAG: response regulator [Gammaproteobacteria bacterium]
MSKKKPKLLTCSFPTTVVFVDDDFQYLQGILPKLDVAHFVPKFYGNPLEALKALENYESNRFTDQCLPDAKATEFNHRTLETKIRTLHHQIYNPKRFEQISVLVVDFAMPGMTGIELCKQLSNKPFKTLLLTGQADEKTVIQAFQQGIIHKYIRKDSFSFHDELNQAIRELQQDYFTELSTVVVDSIVRDPEFAAACIDDPVFISLAEKICSTPNIVEFHLTDTQGSYLLLDKEGRSSWLTVADSEQMQMYYELSQDVSTPVEVIEALKNRQMVPYFQSEADFNTSPINWKKYLHPAQVLQGKETYYYAHIANSNAYQVDAKKLASYQGYLESL